MAKFDPIIRGGRVIDTHSHVSLGVRIKTDKRLKPVLALRAGQGHRSRSPLLQERVPEAA